MPLTIGSALGPYVIEAPLGAGGMGEVYRARDSRLKRTVAIKVLSPRLSDDDAFRKRFEREARAIAGLEHPHICPLYDIGEHDGASFLVMQHLQGETLAGALTRGPLSIASAVQYGVQIAQALDAAHRAGVIHRDLKPANVMITKSGVHLLDFGLARMDRPGGAAVVANRTTTLVSEATGPGTFMGTLPYMAPEQLEGRSADARTDIFALGVMLYEMITGRRPFEGASRAAQVASIMAAEPAAMASARPGVPPSVERVVRKCLAKDPDARWQDAGDLAAELQWVGEQVATVTPGEGPALGHGAAAWGISAMLAAVMAGAAVWLGSPAAVGLAHLTVDLPSGAQLDRLSRSVLALSPDGRLLVYAARLNGKETLFRRAIDRLDSEVLTDAGFFSQPFFSPDGRWLAFQSSGALSRIAIGGGAPVTIARLSALTGGAWGADDHIVFVDGIRAPVSRVPASGGEARHVTTLDGDRGESSHRFPEVLPGGRTVIFTAGPPVDGPWHEADIVAQSLDSGERRVLIRGAAQARYVAPGYLVYSRAGRLYAVGFDAGTARVNGTAVAVLDGVRENPGHGAAQFVVSRNGTLAYVSGGLESSQVVLVDREGQATPLMPAERRLFSNPRFSPDGRRLALTVGGGNDAAFVHDLERGGLSRVTFDTNHINGIWSPDGKQLTTQKSVTGELVATTVDQRSSEEVLYRGPAAGPSPGSWSRDGRSLVFTLNADIWRLSVPEGRAEPLLESRFREVAPALSPDGRWLAYASDESGLQEIYVQESRQDGRRWRVSRAGGSEPVWAADGKRLYLREGSKLLAVGAQPPFAGAVELFDAPWALTGNREYDVSPDGRRFVMIRPQDPSTARINVILNWVEELQRRVPR